MNLSLYQKLAMSLTLLFALIGACLSWWFQSVELDLSNETQQSLHKSLAAKLLNDNPLLATGATDYEALSNAFHTMMILGPAFEFYVLDNQGKIKAFSAEEGKIKRTQLSLTPIQSFLKPNSSLPILGDDPRHSSRSKIFSVEPIFNQQQQQVGYFYVIIGGEAYDSVASSVASSRSMRHSMMIMFASLSGFLLVALLLFRWLTEPVRCLLKDMQSLRNANFMLDGIELCQWCPKSKSEIQQLGITFTEMAEQIQSQIKQIQSVDLARREMLIHISHDLRTPLATLKAYLETWSIKSSSVTEQQAKDFVDTSLKHAQQLKSLIDQLFELAHLESGNVKVNLEPTNLVELLHDIAAKFQASAQQKQVKIALQYDDEVQIPTDIAKFERIITNLVDNAIRHTHAGGSIQLSIKAVGKSVEIAVQDTGEGIASEDLPYIFDARYRGSNTEENSINSGLGLAISKRLSELLDFDIQVSSKINQGTCFVLKY